MEPAEVRLAMDLNKSSKKSITHFEDLSNEIIYDIFQFLDFFHVYPAFLELNIRFKNLLTSSYFRVDINLLHVSKSTFEQYYTNILAPHQHQIRSLHLSNPSIIDHIFLLHTDRLVFSRLEKLSLIDADSKRLEELLIHLVSFSNLTSLIIKCIDRIHYVNQIYHQIFRLARLKYFKLSCSECTYSPSLPIATNEFSPIKYLVIDHRIGLNDLNIFLSYVPQLHRLTLHHLIETSIVQINSHPILLDSLTHVSLHLDDVTFDNFEFMVQHFLNHIRVLFISIKQNKEYLDTHRWEWLIVTSMPYLQIFDISFHYDLYWDDNAMQYIEQMNEFSSFFWTERQWFFEYQICEHRLQHYIRFYSIKPYRRKQFILYKEKYDDMNLNNTKSNIESVDQLDIQDIRAIPTCKNYFPNVTKLDITSGYFTKAEHSLSIMLNHIIPIRQINTLSIRVKVIDFAELIDLLSYTANIHTLNIQYGIDISDFEQLDDSDSFRLVSKINNIKKMTLVCRHTVDEIVFFVKLCSRLEHLTLVTSMDDLEEIIPYLLLKENTNPCYISSLHVTTFEDNIESLTDFLESQKLTNDYLIDADVHVCDRSVYIWR